VAHKYIENPKTAGSGILGCIPQTGVCPNKCEDCFFQSGRSYLEPLSENLPNMPPLYLARHYIVRVNDGNDSNVQRDLVIRATRKYPQKFYNTAINHDLGGFNAPVVLTLNPGKMTDKDFHRLEEIPPNLMFVRFRVNMWNLEFCDQAVKFYTERDVPVILTFMRYYNVTIPRKEDEGFYSVRKNIQNSYWKITTEGWQMIMDQYRHNKRVHSCGTEGKNGTFLCRDCGHCLREYFATMERMRARAIK
jgi:hypothetical protein